MDADFEKYDALDAKEAHAFLSGLDDRDALAIYIEHERAGKDRRTVLTGEVIEAVLQPSEEPIAAVEHLSTEELLAQLAIQIGGSIDDASDEERAELVEFYHSLGKGLSKYGLITEEKEAEMSGGDELVRETITALLEERRGYEMRGDEERIAEVDAELKRLGHSGKPPSKRATTR
jgi:hypothetical protein